MSMEVKDFQTAVRDGDIVGSEEEREIQGILGLVYLLGGAYLLVIEASEIVGTSPRGSNLTDKTSSFSIHRVQKMGMLPVSRKQQTGPHPQQHPALSSPGQRCDEERYLRMLQAPVVAGSLYFSPRYPLHRSLQKNVRRCPGLDFDSTAPAFWGEEAAMGREGGGLGDADSPAYALMAKNGSSRRGTDSRAASSSSTSSFSSSSSSSSNLTSPSPSTSLPFLWNGFLLSNLGPARLFWGTACISGYAVSRSIPLDGARKGAGEAARLTLLSRRSTRMQGTRFYRRGANKEGEVANFVETEVILALPEGARGEREGPGTLLLSHVQVRGSIPLTWSQEPTLEWQPCVRLSPGLPTPPSSSLSLASHGSGGGSGRGGLQVSVTAAHLEQLTSNYMDILLVNLVDSGGSSKHSKAQAALGRRLQEEVEKFAAYVPLDEFGEEGRGALERGGEEGAKTEATKSRSTPAPDREGDGRTSAFSERKGKGGTPRVSLTWFDFHKECGSYKKWGRLKTHLLAQIDALLSSQGWTMVRIHDAGKQVGQGECADKEKRREGERAGGPGVWEEGSAEEIVLREQEGVVRTNCMDNLDRTNVVQSMVAGRILRHALNSLPVGALAPDPASLERELTTLWVENADALSTLYAGTPALKTDFVLTGRRTIKGMLLDGLYAVTRLYINNFWDGYRQDCVSLWLGEYCPRGPSPTHAPISPFPPYRLPFTPGGIFFTLSVALQELPPFQLTLQAGALLTEAVVSLAQALVGTAATASSSLGGRDESPSALPSWWVLAVFSYMMFLLFWVALWECVLFLGPFATLRTLRHHRYVLTDRPRLVEKDGEASKDGNGREAT